MKVGIGILLILLLSVGGCIQATKQVKKERERVYFDEKTHTFCDEIEGCRLRLTNPKGWKVFLSPFTYDGDWPEGGIFVAECVPRLIWLVVTVDKILEGMTFEDYLLTVKLRENLPSWEEVSREKRMINENETFIWKVRYKENGVVCLGTLAFFQRGAKVYVVCIETPEEAYERRREEINEIIQTFNLISE